MMQVHDYSGSNKQQNPAKLAAYDVIVVSYAMVTRELTQGEGNGDTSKGHQPSQGLFGAKYRRVVLDEGHNVSNTSSKVLRCDIHLRKHTYTHTHTHMCVCSLPPSLTHTRVRSWFAMNSFIRPHTVG
jgi:hypothetical protein